MSRPEAFFVVNSGSPRGLAGYSVSQGTHIMKSTSPSTPVTGIIAAATIGGGGAHKKTLCGQPALRNVSDVFTPEQASCRECRARYAQRRPALAQPEADGFWDWFFHGGARVKAPREPVRVAGDTPSAATPPVTIREARRAQKGRKRQSREDASRARADALREAQSILAAKAAQRGPEKRCTSADRDACADVLQQAFAVGALDASEISERLSVCLQAKWPHELAELTADLPES
jgi:hypothetical protein